MSLPLPQYLFFVCEWGTNSLSVAFCLNDKHFNESEQQTGAVISRKLEGTQGARERRRGADDQDVVAPVTNRLTDSVNSP